MWGAPTSVISPMDGPDRVLTKNRWSVHGSSQRLQRRAGAAWWVHRRHTEPHSATVHSTARQVPVPPGGCAVGVRAEPRKPFDFDPLRPAVVRPWLWGHRYGEGTHRADVPHTLPLPLAVTHWQALATPWVCATCVYNRAAKTV